MMHFSLPEMLMGWARREGRRFPRRMVDFYYWMRYLLRQFLDRDVMRSAAALSYSSLLALIPIVAIGFSALASFKAFRNTREQLTHLLVSNLLPAFSEQVEGHIALFLDNVSHMTAIGIGFLAVAAIALFITIEQALNDIWGARNSRSWAWRVLAFWTTLTLGPLAIAVTLSFSSSIVDATQNWYGAQAFLSLLNVALPPILATFSFTLLYLTVPNFPVPWRSALAGGLVAGLLFECARRFFASYLHVSTSYEIIYGTLAALPLFIIWMYLFWLVVLVGGLVAASFSRRHSLRHSAKDARRGRLNIAIRLLQRLWRHQKATGQGLHASEIVDLPDYVLDELLGTLSRGNILASTPAGLWVITRDLKTYTVYDLYKLLGYDLDIDTALEKTIREALKTPLNLLLENEE